MASKLCPHSLYNHADVGVFVDAGCPLVKMVGYFEPAAECLSRRPNLTLVGRVFEPGFDPAAAANGGANPEAEARAWVARQQEQYRLNPLITIWEGPNEPVLGGMQDPANMQAMAWYAAFEAERLRLLADLGLRGVVGNFATGNPVDLPMWLAFLPALAAAEQHEGFLGLHEYASPWMWWLTGRYQTANCDDRPEFEGEGDTGWLTLRYRKVYRDYLAPNGAGDVPLIITECGLDKTGALCAGQTSGPWRVHGDFWAQHDGRGDPIDYWRGEERDPERYYAEQLIWYDRELQKDDYVIGATVFTVGTLSEAWQPFDIGGTRVTQVLAAHIRAEREKDAARPPLPPPIESRPPEAPGDGRAGPVPVTLPLEVEIVRVPPGPAGEPRPRGANLLMNAGFEDGQAYFHDDTRELAVPAGWALTFHDSGTPVISGQAAAWGRPVTALINSRSVAAADRQRVFAGGAFCWKVAAPHAPAWVRLSQSVAGLRKGQRYRFRVNLLPDLIMTTHPRTAYASDPRTGEARLVAAFAELTFDSGWQTGREAPFGRYTPLPLEFIAPSARLEVSVEVRGRWALPLGAWYLDELSLEAV